MKKIIVLSLYLVILLVACNGQNREVEVNIPEGVHKIEVLEHMNGSGYTFLKGEENGKEIWLATKEVEVENGDIVYYTGAIEMKNFSSKSLNKTFESILFVNAVSRDVRVFMDAEKKNSMPKMIPGHAKPNVVVDSDIKVEPLADGKTIESLIKERKSLNGKIVKIRGVVTKYNGEIMGRNWIHIQDGTGYNNINDLTITSDQSTKVGEIIVVEGTVTIDKDFGSGYFYNIIIENASIKVEKKI